MNCESIASYCGCEKYQGRWVRSRSTDTGSLVATGFFLGSYFAMIGLSYYQSSPNIAIGSIPMGFAGVGAIFFRIFIEPDPRTTPEAINALEYEVISDDPLSRRLLDTTNGSTSNRPLTDNASRSTFNRRIIDTASGSTLLAQDTRVPSETQSTNFYA